MHCKDCKVELTPELAVFLTCQNKPSKDARCNDCYERSVRRVYSWEIGEYQYKMTPVQVDALYHGDGYSG